MQKYIKKSLENAVNISSSITYYSVDQKKELIDAIENTTENQYMIFDIQDFDKDGTTETLVFDYSARTITNSSGTTSSLLTKKISNDYSLNPIVLDFLTMISTVSSNDVYISTDDINYVKISEVDINYEISSATGFRLKVEIDDGTFSKLNLMYNI